MRDIIALRLGNHDTTHIGYDFTRTLCGMPMNPERYRDPEDNGLHSSDDDVSCRRCVRHLARDIGKMVEHKLRDLWSGKVGNGSW
jgi:hypothetical protein